jgi:hypothetical protein
MRTTLLVGIILLGIPGLAQNAPPTIAQHYEPPPLRPTRSPRP